VGVAFPGGSVQVNKETPALAAAPESPAVPETQPLAPPTQNKMSRADRRRLRKEMRAKSSANVDVAYPFGSVVVRRGEADAGKGVNVVYPGGSVNVGGQGGVPEGGKPAVNVEYPGGSVRLQPKQPGERRKGVIEFPFGRVVLS